MENQKNDLQIIGQTLPDLAIINDEMMANLETATNVMDITKEYLNLNKDKEQKFLFAGLTEFVNAETGEIIKGVNLVNSKKEMFLTASTVIVNACRDLNPFTPISITYIGDKALGGGRKMKKFKISLLANV